jgi:hypothetical protein
MPVESHMPKREPLWLMRTSSLSSIDRFLLATVDVSLCEYVWPEIRSSGVRTCVCLNEAHT